MALNKSTLQNNITNRIKGIDLQNEDVAAKVGQIVAEEVDTYLSAFVSKFNSHVHAGVIVAVTGGSGAPAVGVAGSSGASNQQV